MANDVTNLRFVGVGIIIGAISPANLKIDATVTFPLQQVRQDLKVSILENCHCIDQEAWLAQKSIVLHNLQSSSFVIIIFFILFIALSSITSEEAAAGVVGRC